MKVKAKEVKKGDVVVIANKEGIVKEVEISDIGKQGTRKVRMVVEIDGRESVIIRPEDYPIERK